MGLTTWYIDTQIDLLLNDGDDEVMNNVGDGFLLLMRENKKEEGGEGR